MTPSELKAKVEATGSYFFTRNNMRFAGDMMKNYGCCSAAITTRHGIKEVWELWRKRPVKGGNQNSVFFDKETFEQVFSVEEYMLEHKIRMLSTGKELHQAWLNGRFLVDSLNKEAIINFITYCNEHEIFSRDKWRQQPRKVQIDFCEAFGIYEPFFEGALK